MAIHISRDCCSRDASCLQCFFLFHETSMQQSCFIETLVHSEAEEATLHSHAERFHLLTYWKINTRSKFMKHLYINTRWVKMNTELYFTIISSRGSSSSSSISSSSGQWQLRHWATTHITEQLTMIDMTAYHPLQNTHMASLYLGYQLSGRRHWGIDNHGGSHFQTTALNACHEINTKSLTNTEKI